MRYAIGLVFVLVFGILFLSEVEGIEFEASVGLGWLEGDNIAGSETGSVLNVGASRTLVSGVDYFVHIQYARISAEVDFTYVYRSGGLGVRWYPSRQRLVPYAMGRLGLYDWRIERGGETARNPDTGEQMRTRSLGLGGGIGVLWRLSDRLSADLAVLSDFVFSQDPEIMGPEDENEVLLQSRVGLRYRLF
ncbi:hypothetical protein AMJ40_06480 [candidate division TA06 bacterium DG_26]|uniref:Outer membrane protein beta-barrel domain-containing protein n=1 Tax=candidate division TA06 bacterium DG_26 TaxID=1703771 RepID=A0A0S7WFQ1_UNCT6|nr:MAG: hypothetical protein AMJ40_06480 [candidate division TA06 bacterium DG_26]